MYSDYALIIGGEIVAMAFGTYFDCDRIAKQKYGNEAFAVEVWSHYYPQTAQWPVIVGDTYDGTFFYHDGVKVDQVPTERMAIAEQSVIIDDLIIAITPTEAN